MAFQLLVSLCLLIVFGVVFSAETSPLTNGSKFHKPQSHAVIIDTDMAFDDWAAILYILKHKQIEVLAITVAGSGEAHCPAGVQNALKLIYLARREADGIPVACGDELPMAGRHVFPEKWRTESDTMYGVDLPESPQGPSRKHAVRLILDALRSRSKPVDIVALGPLTNIGQALIQSPASFRKVAQLYIMGGAIRVHGNVVIKGVTENLNNYVAEWNIFVDPLAAQHVFTSKLPITLVPLDATNQLPMTEDFANAFKRRVRTSEAVFLDRIYDKNAHYIKIGQYYFWDVVAASLAVDNSLCTYEILPLKVVVEYEKAGRAPTDKPTKHTSNLSALNSQRSGQIITSPTGKSIRVCMHVDRSTFEENYISKLNANHLDSSLKRVEPPSRGV